MFYFKNKKYTGELITSVSAVNIIKKSLEIFRPCHHHQHHHHYTTIINTTTSPATFKYLFSFFVRLFPSNRI